VTAPLNVLSLFAGIGGLELGLERAGMRTVGQVEIDPYCRRVLEKHWPDVPRHDDVRTAADWWLSTERPTVDVGAETTMGLALCETYARDPNFYGATYCVGCRMHRPVAEFVWSEDGQTVGS